MGDYMKKFSIIFDLDGTLWDSSETTTMAWKNILFNYNNKIDVSEKNMREIAGKTIDEISNILLSNIDDKEEKNILDKCLNEENNMIRKNGGKLFDSVIETLDLLNKEYDLYIVSNCQSGYIESFLDYYNLNKYFIDIECNGNNNKSKKDNISLIIQRNNIEKCCYVGDTNNDSISAKENNIPFIYASYGFENVNYYDEIIYNFSELIDVIKKIS